MMVGSSTIAGQIEALVTRLDGAAICDGCITDRVNLSATTQANAVTRLLPGQRGFERNKAACALCGTTRLVIRRSAK